MSAKSSFQRNSMNGLFPSLLNPDSHQSSSSGSLSSNMAFSDISSSYASAGQQRHQGLAPETNNLFRHQQRPVSEILKPESSISPETEALDKWFEDLQQYESSLESMATASLDPKYKEEVQHVDQWFRYLNEAERTATIYTLLQHSTQVQIRFFIAVLQQMSNKDPLGALLSPAHPEKVDMQAKLAGAMKKAELEASQKLLSVLPYQTGQVISRPNANSIGRRNHIDRHSFALGDTNEYDRLFTRMPGSDFLNPSNGLLDDGMIPQQLARNQHQQRSMFDHSGSNSRPRSVIEGDLSSIFSGDWSYGSTAGGLASHQKIHQKQAGSVGSNRPKSADVSNWSFGMSSSVSSKSIRDKDPLSSPWSGLSPTVSTFAEQSQQQQQQQSERPQSASDMDQQLSLMANNWSLNNNGGSGRSVVLSEDTKSFRRRAANRTSIPGTVPETDERVVKNGMQSPPPPAPSVLPNPANIVLSMYEDNNAPSATILGASDPYYLIQPIHSRPTSGSAPPAPAQSNPNNMFANRTTTGNKSQQMKQQQQQQQSYGQFLNPNDRAPEPEAGYLSDHSDASNRSTGSRAMKKKNHNSGHHTNSGRGSSGANNNSITTVATPKEKKNMEAIDMKLLEDVPAWLRSLRLHKYNPIFETMKWQDMLKLDDEALLGKGVAALGARRKLLKVFDQVKTHCEANNIVY